MDKSEALAKLLIEKAFPGSIAEYHQEQHTSVSDFSLTFPNRSKKPLEVTQATDRFALCDMRGLEMSSFFRPAKHCRKSWMVVPEHKPVKGRWGKVDKCLAKIEQKNISEFNSLDAESHEEVLEIVERCGIVIGKVTDDGTPGISVAFVIGDDAVTDTRLIGVIEAECSKQDNRNKLSPGGELFIILDWLKLEAFTIVTTRSLPTAAKPILPPEVERVWIAARKTNRNEYVVWSFSESSDWQDCGCVTVSDEDIEVVRSSNSGKPGK